MEICSILTSMFSIKSHKSACLYLEFARVYFPQYIKEITSWANATLQLPDSDKVKKN